MNKLAITTILSLLLVSFSEAQVKGRTKVGTFETPERAKLSAVLEFTEPSGNKILDGGETGILRITITNSGDGPAEGVQIRLIMTDQLRGVSMNQPPALGTIAPNGSKDAKIELRADENAATQTAVLTLEAVTSRGTKSPPQVFTLNVATKVKKPLLAVTLSFSEPSGNSMLDGGETGSIRISVTNSGNAPAQNVTATIQLIDPLKGVRYPATVAVGSIPANSTALGVAQFTAEDLVESQTARITIDVADAAGNKSEPQRIVVPVMARAIARDETPPEIEVWEPVVAEKRGIKLIESGTKFSTTTSSVTVRGLAKDANGVAVVFINNIEARISQTKEGFEFVGDALLVLGENDIEVRALDRFKNENKLSVRVTRRPEVIAEERPVPANLFKGQRWAVVIGISKYKNTEIPQLRWADRDAEEFYKILTKPIEQGGVGVPVANTRYLLNEKASSFNVREALTDFLKGAIEEDLVFIYFAGHGAPDPDRPKILYLLTNDSDLNSLAATSVRMQEIQDAMQYYVAAKTVLVFADACHSRGVSGALATRTLAPADLVNEFLSDLARTRPSTLTFSASDVNQLSQEDRRWGDGHGVFTHYLLEGLRGKADMNRDRIVRLGELTQYVNDNVRRDTKAQQSPISSGSFDINMPLTIVP
ncbi:MAG: hypothetical protein FJ215_11470 [Ignavibacteria bacterium]|nr:hypothetical protein [Ignavibacteria bacterium]